MTTVIGDKDNLIVPEGYSWYSNYNNKADLMNLMNLPLVQSLKPKFDPSTIKAIFVPHAGLNYSGVCAAVAYSPVLYNSYDTVIILCTDHYNVPGLTFPEFNTVKVAGYGDIKVNKDKLHQIEHLGKINNDVFIKEHSFHNQLPFIAMFDKIPRIVPVVCGETTDLAEIAQVVHSMLDDRTLLVCTSDLSHVNGSFLNKVVGPHVSKQIIEKDSIATKMLAGVTSELDDLEDTPECKCIDDLSSNIDKLIIGGTPKLDNLDNLENTSVCGPYVIRLMYRILGLTNSKWIPRLVCYYNSLQVDNLGSEFELMADVKDTDTKTVSYASMIYSTLPYIDITLDRSMINMLTRFEQLLLAKYAEDSIKNKFIKLSSSLIKPLFFKALTEKRAVFITIRDANNKDIKSNLRGCIGTLDATSNTIEYNVKMYACKSAYCDPRFHSMTCEEVLGTCIGDTPTPESVSDLYISKFKNTPNKSYKYSYSVSLLAPLKEITLKEYFGDIIYKPGKDGIQIKSKGNSAYFLPDVITEYSWDKDTQLQHLCEKAGLDEMCYKKDANLWYYNEGFSFSIPDKNYNSQSAGSYDRYYQKYLKYLYKCEALQQIQTGGKDVKYSLLHFNDISKQVSFIKKHIKEILSMSIDCFPSNVDMFPKSVDKNKWLKDVKDRQLRHINSSMKEGRWFFALKDTIIAGFCVVGYTKLINSTSKLETYKVVHLTKSQLRDVIINTYTVKAYLSSLCKKLSDGFEGVGSFILDSVSEYYKGKTGYLYLTPESIQFKDGKDNCILHPDYFKSNKRLVEYYKKNGFKISKNLYEIDECSYDEDKYIIFNVMEKRL